MIQADQEPNGPEGESVLLQSRQKYICDYIVKNLKAENSYKSL